MTGDIEAPPWQLSPVLLRLQTWKREGRRVFLVASNWPDEGKTSLTINLGHLVALNKFSVLLVDGDFHRSTLSQRFSCPGPGLLDCLQGRSGQCIPIQQNLAVMGVGQTTAGADFRPGPGGRQALRQAVEGYDLVLVDSPALSASSVALSLAPLCDGVILVASKRAYRDYQDASVVEQFRLQGIPVEGVIVTHENAAASTTDTRSLLGSLLAGLGLRA